MKKIECYKTKDGMTFSSEEEAKVHENEIAFKDRVGEFVDIHCWSGMSKSDITDFIIENSSDLKKIL